MAYSMYETQFKIIGPNGTVVFTGTGRVTDFLEVALNDTTACNPGEGLIIDAASTVIGSPTATAAVTEVYGALRIVGAASKSFLGVTPDSIRARTGATGIGMSTGRVAASGSIVPVRTNGTAAKDALVISSSTAGQVTTGSSTTGNVLGVCVVANASVGGVNIAGVLISQQ